jgi:hypothetical protein
MRMGGGARSDGDHGRWGTRPRRIGFTNRSARGRIDERLGDRARAARSYSWVTGMWRHADPELEPYADEARAALNRLTAEGE